MTEPIDNIAALLEQADKVAALLEDGVKVLDEPFPLTTLSRNMENAATLVDSLASALRRVSEERDELVTCDCDAELHCIEDRLSLAGHNVSLRKQVHEQRAALQRAREERDNAVRWGFDRGISAVDRFGETDETSDDALAAYLASRATEDEG